LLQLARRVGGRGVSLALALGNLGDAERGPFEVGPDLGGLLGIVDGELLVPARYEARDERVAAGGSAAVGCSEGGPAVPVLDRDERLDLALAVDDEAQGHALHASGAEAECELAPDQGRDVVTDDAVEHPPAPLCVVEVLVERARVGDAVLHPLLGDLVELDPLGRLLGRLELLVDVPGDGFALPVGVGREKDFVDVLRRLLEIVKNLFLARDDLVRLLKALFDIDPELLREVFDVALRRDDLEPRPQVLLDRLSLRGRFDDDERLDHQWLLFQIVQQYS